MPQSSSRDKNTTDGHESDQDYSITLKGCASRAEWELIQLAVRKVAREHGVAVEAFELAPADEDNDTGSAAT